MKTIAEIRRENLCLLEKESGTTAETAARVGMSRSQFANLRDGAKDSKTGNPRGMRDATARRIERKAGKPVGWLDQDHSQPAANDTLQRYAVNGRNIRPIWVVGKTMGGLPERIWGDGDYPAGALSDYAEEASADPNAFLCEVEGISMLERYAPGEYALIEPSTPVEPGDDVLVRLKTGETMLKRLDAMHNGYRLRSLNGGEQLFFYEADVSWVYYVAHPVPRRRIKTRY